MLKQSDISFPSYIVYEDSQYDDEEKDVITMLSLCWEMSFVGM